MKLTVKENIFGSEFWDRKIIPDVTRSKAIIQNKLHTAVASGRWCGGQWPQCGLSGHHESAH